MNANIFRLIFSKRLGMLVPVAEQTSVQGKGKSVVGRSRGGCASSGRSFLLSSIAFGVAVGFSATSLALPTDPSVISGAATFSQVGNVLTVTNSNKAIIDWVKFNIAAGETTRFLQPSASSSVLNRVLTNNPSSIYGNLSSNGQVWLVNTAGILVGPGGVIDTAGFVASTLNVRAEDFLAGRLNFQATPGAGNVVNQGAITSPTGGSVYLVGTNVSNEGIITTPQGETILAAGQTVSLIDTATPGVKVEITGAANNATNLGSIVAAAGRIGIAGAIVKNSGTLDASSVVSEGGRIFLRASQDTYVDGNGRIVATGTKGGQVEVLGNRVAVMDNASIDASGSSGGGTILVGGDFQGKNPDVQNAAITWFGPDATLKANASNNGDGGKVIVWADNTTRAYGNIEARGGVNGGNGGFVEVSGKRYLDFDARVDTTASKGQTGTLLLDPTDITIVATTGGVPSWYGSSPAIFENPSSTNDSSTIGWDDITSQLVSSNVVIQTSSLGAGTGNISINGSPTGGSLSVNHTSPYFTNTNTYSTLYSSSNKLSLWAENAININAPFGNAGSGAIELIAGWDGNFTTPDVGAYDVGKSINMNTGMAMGSTGIISNGNVTLKAADSINIITDSAYPGFAGIDMTSGTLTMVADKIRLISNGGYAVSIRTNGDQSFTLTNASGLGGLELRGSDTNNIYGGGYASIERFGSTSGGQNFTFNDGASLSMYGGSGSGTVPVGWGGDCGDVPGSNCSSNFAGIENYGAGNQTFTFTGPTGNITLTGGTLGNNNGAWIDQEGSGSQIISGNPNITLTGGASGGNFVVYGGENYQFDNGAGISSNGVQTINAQSLTLSGGGGNYSGAYVGGKTQTITVIGAVALTGGTALMPEGPGAGGEFVGTSPALIGWDGTGHSLNLTAGSVTLNGGSVNEFGGSPAAIGTYLAPTNTTITTTSGDISLNSTNIGADWLGSWGGMGGSLTLESAGGISLSVGQVGTGTSGSVTLRALDGSITQDVGGVIKTNTLTADANCVECNAIDLLGGNLANVVNLTAGPDLLSIEYRSAQSFRAASINSAGSVTLDNSLAPPGSYIEIGSITADGVVDITAKGAILDGNGDALNITANGINLTSQYGGSASGLAISADTKLMDGSLFATVDSTANYGGIRISNDGSGYPAGYFSLTDSSIYGGPITFNYAGDFVDASISIASSAGSDIAMMVTGNLMEDDNIGIDTSGSALISAGGDMEINCCLSNYSGSLSLAAGNKLTIYGEVTSGADLVLGAPTIENYGYIDSYGTTLLVAGNYVSYGGSVYATGTPESDIIGLIGGNMTFYGGTLYAAHDVNLTFGGGSSTLAFYYGGSIEAEAYDTIYLNFLGRSSGGILMNDVAPSLPADYAGYFTNAYSDASPGDGLIITYGLQLDPCALSPDMCKPPPPPTDDCTTNPTLCMRPPDDCTNNPAGCQSKPGEDTAEFGESGQGKKKAGRCKG